MILDFLSGSFDQRVWFGKSRIVSLNLFRARSLLTSGGEAFGFTSSAVHSLNAEQKQVIRSGIKVSIGQLDGWDQAQLEQARVGDKLQTLL